ncbi:MAG: hypothetical protein ABI305_05600 [Tepidiformaceae bacterium]
MSKVIRSAGILAAGLLLALPLLASTVANAQAGPGITAAPTDSPAIWTIQGSRFEPNVTLRVMGMDCVEIAPCAMGRESSYGTNGPVFAVPTTSATGTFSVQLDFEGAKPEPSTQSFLVVAFPGSRALLATDPSIQVRISSGATPPPASKTPAPPPSGTGIAASGDHTSILLMGAVALFAVSIGSVTTSLARRDSKGRRARR